MLKRCCKSALLGIVFCLFILQNAAAAVTPSISKSFQSNTTIVPGSLVSLSNNQNQAGYIVPANLQNGGELLGIATYDNASLVTIDNASAKTQVVLSGSTEALVSTINGPIAVGDEVSVSPVNGVGMKAFTGYAVVGVAQGSFDTSSSGAVQKTVTDDQGKNTTISVGYVSVEINIGAGNIGNQGSTNGLTKIISVIAGHQVSTGAAILSSIISFVALVALVTLIYGSIRGSLISIGRNPLARSAIFESLAQVVAMAILIVVIAIITIYLILR